MKLNDLSNAINTGSKRKRIGRGVGSGSGKTSGRGHKGQNSRSGVSLLGFEGGQMPLYRRLPKRGFKNPFQKKFSIVNVGKVSSAVDNGLIDKTKLITQDILITTGLAKKTKDGVKLLGEGKVSFKLELQVDKASVSAVSAIEDKGGKVLFSNKSVTKRENVNGKQKETKKQETATSDE